MPEIERIDIVASALDELNASPFVFVGGSIIALLLTDAGAATPRSTEDVDLVLQIESTGRYSALTQRLIAAGHQPDPTGPVCRWNINGVPTDLMPLSKSILGFSNRWYPKLLANATTAELPSGRSIRIASSPYLIATKLEAFNDRGADDLRMSEDITDIVSILDGRPELCQELAGADTDVRQFVRTEFSRLVRDLDFLADCLAHLPRDEFSAARGPVIRQRIRNIAGGVCG